ncbi:MAG: rod shape-determining protein MreD [Gemmatimonadetes bacterium]|nr:rod shape-determining protein MreD [Gemmatimonadota bacterium]MXY48646.1 rod shape-determining protein MreD [Gemmatimonadota bacterium]MYG85382.1 rod shape-determining protein MreD [Gemmatimonadota bacterium]MYJ89049.1 rod shape-determining protein MreD [Gemmatimonadota bacterium]
MRLKHAILLFLAFVVDSTWGHEIAIRGIRPDFVLMMLIYGAMGSGAFAGTILGFSVGLLEDFNGSPEHLGLNALCNTLVAYGVGIAGNTLYRDSLSTLLLTLLAASFVHSAMYWLVFTRFQLVESVFLLGTVSLPTMLYTISVALLLIIGLTFRQGQIDVRWLFPE